MKESLKKHGRISASHTEGDELDEKRIRKAVDVKYGTDCKTFPIRQN